MEIGAVANPTAAAPFSCQIAKGDAAETGSNASLIALWTIG